MKKVFCYLNSPYLGGAERSFILQAADLRDELGHDVKFFVPFLEKPAESKELLNFLQSNGFGSMKVHHFQYDKSLFTLSRNNPFEFFVLLPLALLGLFKTARNIQKTNSIEGDIWWTGGNKIGFILFALGLITTFRGGFFWHFRDYPFLGGPYRYFWKILGVIKPFDLTMIGNSFDVTRSLDLLLGSSKKVKTACLYNPVGNLDFSFKSSSEAFVIGSASMFAPWKGLHSLVAFAGLYEDKLKALGVSEFVIYGDEIYKTKGAHLGYKSALLKLRKTFFKDEEFLRFAGLQNPDVLFKELDVFIHASLKPEPFGRVLVEAYNSATVLISTGLGGAGELVEDGITGHKFYPYDYASLFEKVKLSVGENRSFFLEQGKQKSLEIEAIYKSQLLEIFR